MKRRWMFALVLIALPGCDGCPETKKKDLYETVKCVTKTYHAAQNGDASTLGINSEGELSTSYTTITIPEAFGTVFECQHGSFVTNRKDIWEKTKQGQEYTCHSEEYWHEYKDGRREFVKFDLIDVTPAR